MDAARALAELTEISSEIEAAAIADYQGVLVAATSAGGDELADAGRALLELAHRARGREPAQLDVATAIGSVFVVRHDGRTIVATTPPEPTTGLVFSDLRACLRALDPATPNRRRTKQGTER